MKYCIHIFLLEILEINFVLQRFDILLPPSCPQGIDTQQNTITKTWFWRTKQIFCFVCILRRQQRLGISIWFMLLKEYRWVHNTLLCYSHPTIGTEWKSIKTKISSLINIKRYLISTYHWLIWLIFFLFITYYKICVKLYSKWHNLKSKCTMKCVISIPRLMKWCLILHISNMFQMLLGKLSKHYICILYMYCVYFER